MNGFEFQTSSEERRHLIALNWIVRAIQPAVASESDAGAGDGVDVGSVGVVRWNISESE